MRTSFKLLAALAAQACAATASLAQPASPDEMHGGPHAMHAPVPHEAMKSSPGAARAPFDLQFLDTMSAHHQSAVEMARLVEERAAHEELKRLAKTMIEEQQREIGQMQEWKRQWYPGANEALNMKLPGMAESMQGMRMDKLEAASGEAFDALFVQMMSRHHEGAIKMARSAAARAGHAELKSWARQMAETQQKEVAQMAQWKKEWKPAAR